MQSKFRKTPGMLFDWISMMSLKLNEREKWLYSTVNAGEENEDLAYISYWMQRFPAPDEMLLLFFYLPDRMTPSCLMTLFETTMKDKKGKVEAEEIWRKIADITLMKELVAQYYFHCSASCLKIEEIGELIRRIHLEGNLRFLLLEFFINPRTFLVSLQRWARVYYEEIETIYYQAADEILTWQERMGEQELTECLTYFYDSKKPGNAKLPSEVKEIIYSVSVMMKNTLLVNAGSTSWCILGKEYHHFIQKSKEEQMSIDQLGNAVGDRNRAAIMEYIMAHGETSSVEIAKSFGIALNTASYHLEVMKKAKLLNSYTKGKTTCFWINPPACLTAAKEFQRWARGKRS